MSQIWPIFDMKINAIYSGPWHNHNCPEALEEREKEQTNHCRFSVGIGIWDIAIYFIVDFDGIEILSFLSEKKSS